MGPAYHTLESSETGDQKEQTSSKTQDLRYKLRETVDEARVMCTSTITGFVEALANALPQYQANGVTDFLSDPWWVSMMSYFKATLWLFASIPGVRVPKRHLSDEKCELEKLRVLDVNEFDLLASDAGCREYVEVSQGGFSTSLPVIRSFTDAECGIVGPLLLQQLDGFDFTTFRTFT